MSEKRFTRREVLRAAGVASVGLLATLAGCQPQVTEVEKIVKETVIVEGTPQVVEKVVKETVVVEQEAAQPTAIKGELRLGLINDVSVKGVVDILLAAHGARYPEVEPVIEYQVGDYSERMYTQAAAGTLPDVVFTADLYTIPFSENGVLLDLNPLADIDKEFDRNDVYEVMLGLGEYKGGLYFLPASLDVVTMYYNKTLFEQGGSEAPSADWTWDDFVIGATKVTEIEKSADGTPMYWGLDNRTWSWWATVYPWIIGYGADVLSADRSKSTWSDPATLEALGAYTDLWTKDNVAQPLTLDVGGEAFTLGRAAVFCHIPGQRKHLQESIGDKFEWDVQLLPKMPDGKHRTGMGTWGLGVYAQSKIKEIAWDFIKYMLSESAQLIIAKNMAGIPMLKSLAEDQRWLGELTPPPSNNSAFIKGADDAILPMNDYPLDCGGFYFGEVSQAYTAALEAVIRGEKELEEAFVEADSIIQKCLNEQAI